MNSSQKANLNISQELTFSRSSLPLTMELADILKTLIIPNLDNHSNLLPFHDRVLAWLAPSLKDEIARFHGGVGPALDDIFRNEAIKHIDHELMMTLSREIELTHPGTVSFLKELSLIKKDDSLNLVKDT